MKKLCLLFEHKGENAPTPHEPIAEWNGQVNLEEKVLRCINWDFDALIEINRYKVCEITVPDWIMLEDILNHRTMIDIKFYIAFGGKIELGKRYVNSIMSLHTNAQKLAAIQLLNTKNFRSEFRKSMQERLIEWIESDNKKFDSPFSWKQWDCLIDKRILWDAESRSAGAYRNREIPFERIELKKSYA